MAEPVPPMMPSVSPGLMRKVMSLSTGLPVPCLYLKVTWSNSTLPSFTVWTGFLAGGRSVGSSSTSMMRRQEATDMLSMTKTIDSIIRLIRMFMV